MDAETKTRKADELIAFFEAESARFHMNAPNAAAVRETLDFLAESDPANAVEIAAEDFARLLKSRYPELRFEYADDEREDEPATERQIAYLKVLEVPVPDYLGMRAASDLIDKYKDRVSEGQKRRLNFYKLSFDPNITREKANELIDRYKAEHPESEAAYQEWKAGGGNIEH